jgi:predicted flap endonuclease-1-like 5' DNA nuclease
VLRHAFGTASEVLRDEEPPPRHALTEVPGIGPARARKLARVGIVTAERLARADPAVIARILGHVTVRTARTLVEHAASIFRDVAARG